jgi:SAM-dependent methyltransferase
MTAKYVSADMAELSRSAVAALGRAVRPWHRRAIAEPRVRRVAAALGELCAAAGGADDLLDVGCGNGEVGRLVADSLGARVRGVDVGTPQAAAIEVGHYDGRSLPFEDDSHDVVLLSDVLHHTTHPGLLMSECLRVARKGVALKDHLRFGPVSARVLLWMDLVGNAAHPVETPGRYLALAEWFGLVGAAGGRIAQMRWPLTIHDYPWRLLAPSVLQFAALVVKTS